MNVYTVAFSGHYLAGSMVVVAKTKRKAFNIAKRRIDEMGLFDKNEDFSMEDVIEVDVSREGIHSESDGDY